MYEKVEERCRKYTKRIASYVLFNELPLFPSLFHSFYCLAIGNHETSTWTPPAPVSVPFDTTHIWRWYIQWILFVNVYFVYIYIAALISSSFICFCLYICAICDHFKLMIQSLQKIIATNRVEKNPKKSQKLNKLIVETLCKAVEIEVKALEWVDFNLFFKKTIVTRRISFNSIFDLVKKVYSGVLFSNLPTNAFYVALTLYNLEHVR